MRTLLVLARIVSLFPRNLHTYVQSNAPEFWAVTMLYCTNRVASKDSSLLLTMDDGPGRLFRVRCAIPTCPGRHQGFYMLDVLLGIAS